jgi:NAD(P)-dependent dehydrogenase (short-subunit alcohol dehydrogenase family)
MTGTLQGKVALVTGASSGLGRAAALAFAREGAKVVVADIDVENGQQTVQMIKKGGGEALFVKADVSKAADVKAMVGKAVETYGRLDCAHNNAATTDMPAPLIEGTEEEWDHIMAVNLKSVWLCLKYEISHMVKNGGGAIVNTSSLAGLTGAMPSPMYTASKHGVIGLTRVAAVQYAKAGIRVNVVCPGGMKGTAMIKRIAEAKPGLTSDVTAAVPLGRDAEPAEVAEAVVWLCSDAASYITGHVMPVDGGYTA